jgi:hypothetical protein
MLKHVNMIVGMASVAIAFLLVATYLEEPALSAQVTTRPGMLLDEWLEAFRFWASIGIATAWVAALVWYAASAATNMNDWAQTNLRRVAWWGLFLVPMVAFVAAWVFAPRAQEGDLIAVGFYFLNNVFVYYLATACFSPSSFKYTPVGAAVIRQW